MRSISVLKRGVRQLLGACVAASLMVGGVPIAGAVPAHDAAARQGASAITAGAKHAPDRVIVRFAADATAGTKQHANERAGAAKVKRIGNPARGLVKAQLKKGTSVADAIAAYSKQPGVLYAEPDYLVQGTSVPSDPMFSELWGLNNDGDNGEVADADVDAPEAWDTTTGSNEVVVAIVDSGVDYNHPDLDDNMWVNDGEWGTAGELSDNGVDDDGNGYIDDVHGWDARNFDGDPMDDHSHGTHCAGTVGAEADNGIGVVGVSPNVRIMAVKFLGAENGGSYSDAIDAIEYARLMGADVMSHSWGGSGYSRALYETIANSGVLSVCAAGNQSDDLESVPHYPAAYDLANILAVGASDSADEPAYFSSYGLTSVDVFAPGVRTLSTVPATDGNYDDAYGLKSGTSMATPHVSGLAALLLARYPGAKYPALKQAIMDTVDEKASLAGLCVTGGRVNAAAAVARDLSGSGTGSVTGVVSALGAPLAGVRVKIADYAPQLTDGSGSYSFSGLPAGKYSVTYSAPEHFTRVVSLTVLAGQNVVRNVELQPAGRITGSVLESGTGDPLGRIEVTVYRYNPVEEWWEYFTALYTGADGTYEINALREGAYRLRFADRSGAFVGCYYANASDFDAATDVAVVRGNATALPAVSLQRSGQITGTVTAADTELPAKGVRVRAYEGFADDEGGTYWDYYSAAVAYTKADGTYTLNGLGTGVFRVEFDDPSGELLDDAIDPVSVEVESETGGIDVALARAGRITGSVTASGTGELLEGVQIEAYVEIDNGMDDPWWDQHGAVAYSAADGSYVLKGLDTGIYRLEFTDSSGEFVGEYYDDALSVESATSIPVTAGSESSGKSVVLMQSARISGTVVADDTSDPIEGIEVWAYREFSDSELGMPYWNVVASAETEADGSYVIRGLDAGEYRVAFGDWSNEFVHEYYGDSEDLDTSTPIFVSAGELTDGINASMARRGRVTGTVTAADTGELVKGVHVTAFQLATDEDDGSTFWQDVSTAVTAADGSYTLAGLDTGTYRIWFSDQRFVAKFYGDDAGTPVSVTAGLPTEGISVSLARAGRITGVVSGDDEIPLGDVEVTAYELVPDEEGGGTHWEAHASARTSPDGSYTIVGLDGTYRIGFDTDGVYPTEYYDNAASFASAKDVAVAVGGVIGNINAVLGTRVPPVEDNTPPTVTFEPSATYTDSASIAISATDAGTGVKSITYQLDTAAPVVVSGSSATVTSNALGAHALKVFATDNRNNSSVATTKSFTIVAQTTGPQPGTQQPAPQPGPAATSLGLVSSSATPAYGAAVTLSATLGVGGQTVVFERLSGASWVPAGSAVTGANGVAVFSVAPYAKAKTTYRARFDATATHLASASAGIVVTPKVYLTKGNAPTTMYKGKAKTVYGFLKPKHTSGSTSVVRIYRYKKNSRGVYVKYDYVRAKLSNYSTYSKYTKSFSFPSRGKWRIRAYAPADSKHAATWSSYDYVTVK